MSAWFGRAVGTCHPWPVSAQLTRTYRIAMMLATPFVRWWGRMQVEGLETIPAEGPLLVIGNHDSHWDPLVVGVAGVRNRQIRALAKASLWNNPVLAKILDGMGQIPIKRGSADLEALDSAIRELKGGTCIGVFPEGTISRGARLRARSGAGRLALAVPETQVVCVAVSGVVDIVRFPKRPRIRVVFFRPESGQPQPDENPTRMMVRMVAEIREIAPVAVAGRSKKAAKFRAAVAAASAASAEPSAGSN